MEHMFKKIFAFSLLVSTSAYLIASNTCNTSCNACNTPAKPVTCFIPRSQSFNNMIKNAGMDPDNQFLYDVDGFNGSFKINFEYDQTFSEDHLGQCLFGPAAICVSGCNDNAIAINVVGTQATNGSITGPNGTTDLVADLFFLPKDFSSTITIQPSIQNYNIHLQAYFGFDEWCTGLYARIYAPITISSWKLETTETINSAGTVGFNAGEISSVAVPSSALYTSFLQYTLGNTPLTLPGSVAPAQVVAGPTVQALKYTKFGCCDSTSTTQLADLRGEFGWNFLLDEDYHLGIYLAAAAPTGNGCGSCDDDCNSGLLWSPIAGNGKHWELGGGITGHYTMWRSEDCEQQFDLFVDATINHMFAHTENHTFDLIGKPLSRYIIAEQLTSTVTNGLSVGGTAAKYQFAGAYAPVANFTTLPVQISFPIQADVMAKFVYTCRGFSWAIGYDFWGQTCPSLELGCNDNCNTSCNTSCNTTTATTFPANTWALRGDAHVYGYGLNGPTVFIQPIPATYNATTAFNIGTAFEGPSATPNVNAGVDSAATPVAVTSPITADLVVLATGVGPNIYGSNPPTFIASTDVDYCSITKGLSNSVFTELNYTWIDRECWVPYFGIGARVEFGNNNSNNCNVISTNSVVTTSTSCNTNCNTNCDLCCDNCDTCSVTKWAVWIQAGLSFN